MKRRADESEEHTLSFDSDSSKRSRSGKKSVLVGPLVFNANGALEQAIYAVEPSNLPGVHRLSPQSNQQIRLWIPNCAPAEYPISTFLNAIDGKCIFIFGLVDINLLNDLVIKRFGIVVSNVYQQVSVPLVEDPNFVIATLCNYQQYLGPSMVLVENGEVRATCMLSRQPESILNTLAEWG